MSIARDFPGLRPFKPTPLKVLDPVPSDIDIAQAGDYCPRSWNCMGIIKPRSG
jgi:hypothetical protein